MHVFFQTLFQWLTGAGRETAVLIISVFPFLEVRGAIPLGMAAGMSAWSAFALACLGNILLLPVMLLLTRFVLNGMENWQPLSKFVAWYRPKLESKSAKIAKYDRWGLCLFVSIPIPGTGAWTGAALASFLHIPMKRALPPLIAGILISGLIMMMLMSGVLGFIRLF